VGAMDGDAPAGGAGIGAIRAAVSSLLSRLSIWKKGKEAERERGREGENSCRRGERRRGAKE